MPNKKLRPNMLASKIRSVFNKEMRLRSGDLIVLGNGDNASVGVFYGISTYHNPSSITVMLYKSDEKPVSDDSNSKGHRKPQRSLPDYFVFNGKNIPILPHLTPWPEGKQEDSPNRYHLY